MLNGKGLFIWHDDRLFLGEWKDNMMHGEGTYKWGDGRMFVGQYIDDRKSGHMKSYSLKIKSRASLFEEVNTFRYTIKAGIELV